MQESLSIIHEKHIVETIQECAVISNVERKIGRVSGCFVAKDVERRHCFWRTSHVTPPCLLRCRISFMHSLSLLPFTPVCPPPPSHYSGGNHVIKFSLRSPNPLNPANPRSFLSPPILVLVYSPLPTPPFSHAVLLFPVPPTFFPRSRTLSQYYL